MDEKVYWDDFEKDYLHAAGTGNLNNPMLLETLLNYLDSHKIENLVDVGCAAGSLYYHIKHKDITYYGFDIAKNSLRAGREIYPEGKFQYFDIRTFEFPMQYDVVYSSEMLSHIRLEHIYKAIEKLYNAAKKCLIFSMKFTILESFEFEATHWKYKDRHCPYVSPNLNELVKFLINLAGNPKMTSILYTGKTTWQFLRNTEYAGKTGNFSVIIDKESDNPSELVQLYKGTWKK